MYQVLKNGNKSIRKTFLTYEQARQAVRKLIRETNTPSSDVFWTSNPMIGDYGFSIKKI